MLKSYLLRRAKKQQELRSQLADTLLARLERENMLTVDDNLFTELGVGRKLFFRVVYSLAIQERMYLMAEQTGNVVLMTNMEFHRFMLRRSGLRETEIRLREGAAVIPETVSEHALTVADLEDTVLIDSVDAEVTLDAEIFCDENDSAMVAATLGGATLSGILPDYEEDLSRSEIVFIPHTIMSPDSPAARNATTRRHARQLQTADGKLPGEGELGWFNLEVTPANKPGEKLPASRQTLPDRRREPYTANDEIEIDLGET